jgi:hypothetical protein
LKSGLDGMEVEEISKDDLDALLSQLLGSLVFSMGKRTDVVLSICL